MISIIIPVFNDADGIARTLRAISQQTWPSLNQLEVIVVDNGSKPPIHLAAGYPFALRLVRCETPGSYAARNAGAATAKGDVLVFTDADCTPTESWLKNGVAALNNGNGSVAIGGNVIFAPVDRPTAISIYQVTMGFGQEGNICDRGFSATANLFCTRAQFETVGPFDERLLSGGDREWAWRATLRGIKIGYSPSAIVYTQPRTSLRAAIQQARRIAAGRVSLRKHGLTHLSADAVARERSSIQSAIWLLKRKELSGWDKVRVLSVAAVIRVSSAVEYIRLATGAQPERR